MSKKQIELVKNKNLPSIILLFFLFFHVFSLQSNAAEAEIFYTVRLEKLHPDVETSLVRGARVTDSVSKSRIGTVEDLSFAPHMTETYSAVRDCMVEVPHPYFRDAIVTVRAFCTQEKNGYSIGAFRLFLGAPIYFFTAAFTGIGECTAIYEREATS